MISAEKKKYFEGRFNNKFSREPVYGEGVTTYEEEGRVLVDLQEALEQNKVKLIGSSVVGKEIPAATVAKLKSLDTLAMLGASVFCGENVEIMTEDGGVIVIGDDCVIYDTTFKVSKGAVLLIENSILLGSEVIVEQGEHRIINTNLSRVNVQNSTLNDIEAKDSEIKSSLIRDAHFLNASITKCIGSAGGSEIGGIYHGKTLSYALDPITWASKIKY